MSDVLKKILAYDLRIGKVLQCKPYMDNKYIVKVDLGDCGVKVFSYKFHNVSI